MPALGAQRKGHYGGGTWKAEADLLVFSALDAQRASFTLISRFSGTIFVVFSGCSVLS